MKKFCSFLLSISIMPLSTCNPLPKANETHLAANKIDGWAMQPNLFGEYNTAKNTLKTSKSKWLWVSAVSLIFYKFYKSCTLKK